MKRISKKRLLKWVVLLVLPLLAILFLLNGLALISYHDPETSYYNQAMSAYQQDFQNDNYTDTTAPALFQKVISAYQAESNRSRLDQSLHGMPSAETASLAELHLGVLLLWEAEGQNSDYLLTQSQLQQMLTQSMNAFEAAIGYNPGGPYAPSVTASEAQKYEQIALLEKYDLEQFFQKNPQQEKKGAGQPKPGNKQGNQKGTQPAYQKQSQNINGKGDNPNWINGQNTNPPDSGSGNGQ